MTSSSFLLFCVVGVYGLSTSDISTTSETDNGVTEPALPTTSVSYNDILLNSDEYFLNRIPEQPPGISVISPVLIKKQDSDDLHHIVDSIYEFSYKRYIVN